MQAGIQTLLDEIIREGGVMKSQKAKVLSHLKRRGILTSYHAARLYKIMRLSERIRELESDRHLINHVPVVRGGHRWTAYSLVA